MRRALATCAALSVALTLVPSAAAEEQPVVKQSSVEQMSSTEKGSPAAQATTVVTSVLATAGVALVLAALVQGTARILSLAPPPLPRLPQR